jgi:nucleolin
MEKALKLNHVIDTKPVECRSMEATKTPEVAATTAPTAANKTPKVAATTAPTEAREPEEIKAKQTKAPKETKEPKEATKAPKKATPKASKAATKAEDSSGWECFVGGLPKKVDATALQNHFRSYGEVTGGRIMIDEQSQESRGFGFVQFASKDNVAKVLAASHKIEGVLVSTKIAEPLKAKQAAVAGSNSIFLGGLPKVVPDQELRDMCSKFGVVNDVIVKVDSLTGNCRGFAFVSFAKRKGFTKCLEAAAKGAVTFQGRSLTARPTRSKTSKDSYYKKGEGKRQKVEK